ncbi:MAG: hypothetical protein LBD04_00120, partial [Synergistaceae bacterium]|nr:hypothetical protein [Synergistaceae bacterium]
ELLDVEKTGNRQAAENACHFLARIAFGENHFIRSPATVYHTKYYKEVERHRPKVKAYFNQTGSQEALRLLCFLMEDLPYCLDFSYENALFASNGDEGQALLRQASTLIVQGFLAARRGYAGKGYPSSASEINSSSTRRHGHVAKARKLMRESPSLLVRGCAALCLAYTGVVDEEVLALLTYLGQRKLNGIAWSWDEDFGDMARAAWLFSADMDMLLDSAEFLTLEYTSTTPEGVVTKHYTPSEKLAVAANRAFPLRHRNKTKNLPLLELSELQKRVLWRIVEKAPLLFRKSGVAHLNLPENHFSALRALGESAETLCQLIDGKPLWFILERALMERMPETIAKVLARLDAWRVLSEIYRPAPEFYIPFLVDSDRRDEECTLNLWNKEHEERLQDVLASALSSCTAEIKLFLDENLEIAAGLGKNDWSTKIPAQRVGVSMLALCRSGAWENKYDPLARPYHFFAECSTFPLALLKEVLTYTSEEHQKKMKQDFKILRR